MKSLKKIFLIQIISIFVLFLTSCSTTDPIQFKKVNSFNIEQGEGSAKRIKTNVTLFNPNSYSCKIQNADIDVSVEGIKLGKLNIPKGVKIKSKSDFSGDYYIDIDLPKVFTIGALVLPKIKRGDVNIHFTGTAKASFLFVTKKIKIDKVEKISLK